MEFTRFLIIYIDLLM